MMKKEDPNDAIYTRMFCTAEDCVARDVEWLVPGYIPAGHITVFAGAGETGKSLFAIDVASKTSRGQRLDFDTSGTTPQSGNVLILAHEDTVEDVIKPRLAAAGADMKRIHFRAGKMEIRLPQHIPAIGWLVKKHNIKVIIIDTLDDFSSKSTKNNQSARVVLNALGNLAEETKTAIVIICHWTKQRSDRGSLRTKIAGTFGIQARARCTYAFVRDPDDKGILMISTKGNIGGPKPTVLFDIGTVPVEVDGKTVGEHPKIIHCGTSPVTEEYFEGTSSKVDEACDYLKQILGARLVDSRTIIEKSPVSRQTLFKAKKRLEITDFRIGQGKEQRSFWRLPRPDGEASAALDQAAGGPKSKVRGTSKSRKLPKTGNGKSTHGARGEPNCAANERLADTAGATIDTASATIDTAGATQGESGNGMSRAASTCP